MSGYSYDFTPEEEALLKRAEAGDQESRGQGNLWGSLIGGGIGAVGGGIAGNIPGAITGASTGAALGGGLGNMIGGLLGQGSAQSALAQAEELKRKKMADMQESERQSKVYDLLAPWLRVRGM